MSEHQSPQNGPAESSPGRRFKTRHLIILLLAGLLALGSLGAVLHAGEARSHRAHFGGHHGGHHGGGHAFMIGRLCGVERGEWLDERIDLVESFVDFTPEQELAWTALKDAVRAGGERVGQACASIEPADDGPTGRLAQVETMLAAGLDVVRGVRPAFEEFYAVLERDQQAALDRLMERRGGRD